MDFMAKAKPFRKNNVFKEFWKKLVKNKLLFLMIAPGTIYLLVFHYAPLAGLVLAFKDFAPGDSFFSAEFVGLKWFREFFGSIFARRLIRNTILIHFYDLFWGFPIPIIFALLLNEIKFPKYKKFVQTVSYFPHFISTVVICGLIVNFLSPNDGLITRMIYAVTGNKTNLMIEPNWFRTIYVGSNIWSEFGWNSIIYIAALTSVDPQLYEAADIEGANRWHKIKSISIPTILPTIVTLLILSLGRILNVGYEKIILLYSEPVYETADVISTYVYRRGLLGMNYSFGVAVGLFNSIANFIFLVIVNQLSKKLSEVSLW